MTVATKNKVVDFGRTAFNKAKSAYYGVATGLATGLAYGTSMISRASFDEVSITATDTDAGALMGKIIGILLTVMRYVGVAMVVYGVYEIVMSIQNNQPEAKTKGIIMALSGVIMIAIKSVLSSLGLIG